MRKFYNKLFAKVGILTVLSIIAVSGCSSHTNDTRSFGKGEISLTVPAELSVRIVDGKIIQVPDYRDETYTIRLTTGRHSLTFKYIDNWNNNM